MTRTESRFPKSPIVALALAAGVSLVIGRLARSPSSHDRAAASASEPSAATPGAPASADCSEHRLMRPTGTPIGLGCADVRRVIRQIHARFPAPIAALPPNEFAELVTSWLDPHGLWSAANDAPPRALVFAGAERLLSEVLGKSGSCETSREVGVSLVSFMVELRGLYDDAAAHAPRLSRDSATELGLEPAFDDDQVTTPARVLARDLGRRLGAIADAYGEAVSPYVRAGRERYFPVLDADGWQRVVLAAALRGYVAAIDPHGQWAPLDEEWSLYGGDPSFYDPDRLWGDMVRTAFGLRVTDQPVPPLEIDDLVLEVDGVATTGLSFEQAEQLSRVPGAASTAAIEPRRLVVLRQGEASPRSVEIPSDARDDDGSEVDPFGADELDVELVPYGRSYAAVISVPFVRDDLGARIAEAMDSLISDGPPEGLLLDLRGNAGGSMDGATSALSVFLPDVPVFPLFHGGRMVEVLTTRGSEPRRFHGPLAVLVDGRTASAAEMIAGALDRYHRAVLLGQPTYGKGCVQEYFEDDAGAGVLRLTTRLFTLPDGSAVQRRGLVPAIPLHLPRVSEHEADVVGALAAVEGPDVRVALPAAPAWPTPSGRLGPCRERVVCSALEKAARVPARAFRSDFSPKGRRRGDPIRR